MWSLKKILSRDCQEKLDEARCDIRILQDRIDALEQERDILYESPHINLSKDVSDE